MAQLHEVHAPHGREDRGERPTEKPGPDTGPEPDGDGAAQQHNQDNEAADDVDRQATERQSPGGMVVYKAICKEGADELDGGSLSVLWLDTLERINPAAVAAGIWSNSAAHA